ncbi:MAG: hypothetical protein ACLTE2_05125 [Eubacteriales bacterium]
MNKKQQKYISDYFDKVLFPVLTPLAVDESRPFPLLANKSLTHCGTFKGVKMKNPALLWYKYHPFCRVF